MYLNIGKNKSLRERSVIGIFDMDNATVSQITRSYLTSAQKEGRLESCGLELPKSFILCFEGDDPKNTRVCFSKLSAASLLGRLE